MKHVMIVLTLCMLVASGRSQQETSLAWKTDSLVRMSDSTLLIHMVYPVLTDTGAVADSINRTVMGVIRSSFDEQDSLRGDYTLDQSIDSMMAYKNNDEYLRKMPYTFVSEGTAFRYDNVVTTQTIEYTRQTVVHVAEIATPLIITRTSRSDERVCVCRLEIQFRRFDLQN